MTTVTFIQGSETNPLVKSLDLFLRGTAHLAAFNSTHFEAAASWLIPNAHTAATCSSGLFFRVMEGEHLKKKKEFNTHSFSERIKISFRRVMLVRV